MFGVTDENLKVLYKRKLQEHLDREENNILREFRKLHDRDQLKSFLHKEIDLLIEDTPFFIEPFEKELESRLAAKDMPMDVKTYIRQTLTEGEVCVYYQADFNLGDPILSAILLKKGTPLHNHLEEHLEEATYYYDTQSGDSAEALRVYNLDRGNLVKG
jgi:hypothetical protein